ncbi:hypothetical protein GCM10022398_31080 [Acetobacter lovaniensis]|nr:hypothetical protein AA0474_2109 [Acetobacter lovaniensis NRIC 0474]
MVKIALAVLGPATCITQNGWSGRDGSVTGVFGHLPIGSLLIDTPEGGVYIRAAEKCEVRFCRSIPKQGHPA